MTRAQGTGETALGHCRLGLLLLLEIDSDNHGWSIVRVVVLPVLPPAVAHVVRLTVVPTSSVSTASSSCPVAALVVMVMMALLLALDADIAHDHLGSIALSVVTAPERDFTT